MLHFSAPCRCLTIGLAALAFAALPAAAQATTSAKPPITLGVNIDNAPDQMSELQTYAQAAGAKPAIVMWYQAWSEPLYYSDQFSNLKAFGGVPMITWDPIVNGVGVPLRHCGRQVRQLHPGLRAGGCRLGVVDVHPLRSRDEPGRPIRFRRERKHACGVRRRLAPRGHDLPPGPRHQRPVGVVAERGLRGGCPFTAYYPGDQWVDWVALDGYNYAGVDNVPWYTFSQIFGPSYNVMESLTKKPVMIAETASSNLGGSGICISTLRIPTMSRQEVTVTTSFQL